MEKAVVILPTYNERENIGKIVPMIFNVANLLKDQVEISILVVDDNSPDGTSDMVKFLQETYQNLYLISDEKQGLGRAYVRGMKYAIESLHADIVFEMDADLSHDPASIPL